MSLFQIRSLLEKVVDKMAHQSTRPFTANVTSNGRLSLSKHGRNVPILNPKMANSSRRSGRCCTVVAQSNPVAEVQQTLERTVSGVADKVMQVATDTIDQAKGMDLREVILLQGASGAECNSYWKRVLPTLVLDPACHDLKDHIVLMR